MREDIIKIISKVSKIEESYLMEHSSEMREWDSMKHIEILLLIEEEYDIRFSEETIASLNCVDAICEAVERMV